MNLSINQILQVAYIWMQLCTVIGMHSMV